MFEGPAVVHALKRCGVTHVVWIPDSELGTWEAALRNDPDLRLIRVTREGEAIAVAGGLMLGGKQPVVIIQTTGLFEAGDALRNVVYDLKLPLFMIVGLRGHLANQQRGTFDTCPHFAEPILRAWQVPYRVLRPESIIDELTDAYTQTRTSGRAGVVCIPE